MSYMYVYNQLDFPQYQVYHRFYFIKKFMHIDQIIRYLINLDIGLIATD